MLRVEKYLLALSLEKKQKYIRERKTFLVSKAFSFSEAETGITDSTFAMEIEAL